MDPGVEDRIAALEAAVEDLRAENQAIAIMVRHLMEVNGGKRDSQRGDDPRSSRGNNVLLPLGEHGVSSEHAR